MQIQLEKSLEQSKPARKPAADHSGSRWALWWWIAFGLLLVANLPLMICMALTADPITYDLQAKTALDGGVLYRDLVEPNLPGVVWVHMVVRSILGWSSYALRSFDLVVFAGITILLLRIAKSAKAEGGFQAHAPALALLLCWFYFSMSAWAHCQRDIWMMLPALGALSLRVWQLRRFSTGNAGRKSLFFWGVLEGVLWGMAFWIKPFVAIPALASLVVSAGGMKSRAEWLLNLAGVLAGGLFVGACGSLWLIETGAWPYFWDMALHWNPEYLEVGRERWTWKRYWSLTRRFLPWTLVHIPAIFLAIKNLARIRFFQRMPHAQVTLGLMSAVYLGWVIQAHTLQHLFDYAHVPGILLGLSLLAASWPAERAELPIARMALASLVVIALLSSPATSPKRLGIWQKCLTEGSSPEVRCALQHVPLPNWKELEPIVDFLKSKNLEDGELTAYNVFLIHLYPRLDLEPSTRYVFLDAHIKIFTRRTELIRNALEESPQRFVVSSLLESGMEPKDIAAGSPEQPGTLPENFPKEELAYFPFNQKLVFRSGQYVVHEVTEPVGPLNTEFFPLLRKPGRKSSQKLTADR